MKFLSLPALNGELLNLIHSARKYLVLVSPSLQLNHWPELSAALEDAIRRGVRVEAFLHNEPANTSWEQVEALGISPRRVANLHATFYYTESGGLVTTSSLLENIPDSLIGIGCRLEFADELKELREYVKLNLLPSKPAEAPSAEELLLSTERFLRVLKEYLWQHLRRPIATAYHCREYRLALNRGDRFTITVDKKLKRIRIETRFSPEETDEYDKNGEQYFLGTHFDYSLSLASDGSIGFLLGEYNKRLSTSFINRVPVSEKKAILDALLEFIRSTRALKESVISGT